MKDHAWIATAIALFAPAAVTAAPANFSYHYVEAGFHSNRFDGNDGNGVSIEFSYAATENYFFIGRFSKDSNELTAVTTINDLVVFDDQLTLRDKLELSERKFALGMGGAWPVNQTIDFMAEVLYVDAGLDIDFGGSYHYSDGTGYTESGSYCDLDPAFCGSDSIDDTGLALRAGLRVAASASLELFGAISSYQFDVYKDFEEYLSIWYPDLYDAELGSIALELGGRYAINATNAIELSYVKHGDLTSMQIGWRMSL